MGRRRNVDIELSFIIVFHENMEEISEIFTNVRNWVTRLVIKKTIARNSYEVPSPVKLEPKQLQSFMAIKLMNRKLSI